MAIRITCPGCQTALTLDDKMRGKKVRCKACAKVLSIPAVAKAKALAHAGELEEETVQDEPRVKLKKASAPPEDDSASDDDRPAKKKKKKKNGKKGSGALIIGGVAALFLLLLAGGGLWAFFAFRPGEEAQKKKQEQQALLAAKAKNDAESANKAPAAKEKDERSPARIVVPGIKEGNPANNKKGGTGIVSDVRGAVYRTERQSELRQIAISYQQYSDDYKGANRNMDTWLVYIKDYGPIKGAVKDGYYKMNFSARAEGTSIVAYERDIDRGDKHLCAFYSGTVDYVPVAELKTILGRDP
jgi:ribosomal protein S27E